MADLAWELEGEAGERRVRLSGDITEQSDFRPLLEALSGAAVLDLAGIRRINSCGVREWVKFVAALGANGVKLALERCSAPVVAQLNMIANFGGGAEVRSIYAPYFCGKCGKDHLELIELRPGRRATVREALPCPSCGASMEFDDVPEAFLAFQS